MGGVDCHEIHLVLNFFNILFFNGCLREFIQVVFDGDTFWPPVVLFIVGGRN